MFYLRLRVQRKQVRTLWKGENMSKMRVGVGLEEIRLRLEKVTDALEYIWFNKKIDELQEELKECEDKKT